MNDGTVFFNHHLLMIIRALHLTKVSEWTSAVSRKFLKAGKNKWRHVYKSKSSMSMQPECIQNHVASMLIKNSRAQNTRELMVIHPPNFTKLKNI